jgi:hypothetical protein
MDGRRLDVLSPVLALDHIKIQGKPVAIKACRLVDDSMHNPRYLITYSCHGHAASPHVHCVVVKPTGPMQK